MILWINFSTRFFLLTLSRDLSSRRTSTSLQHKALKLLSVGFLVSLWERSVDLKVDSRMVTEQCVPGRNFQSRHRAFGAPLRGPLPAALPRARLCAQCARRQAGRRAGLRTRVPFVSRKLLRLKLVWGQEPIAPSARTKGTLCYFFRSSSGLSLGPKTVIIIHWLNDDQVSNR